MSRNQLGLFNEIKEIVFKQDFERGVKICSKCKETLPITKFAILVRKDLNYRRSACKKCSNEAAIVTGKLKLEVGKKPDICDCCNRVVNEIVYNSKIVLDHCHDTESFRGWICYACNQGIGKLGDNLEGVVKAALYLSNNNINLILKTIEKIKK
tara:strand:+ start:43 stop:504 length:462 start_codon:yes stop_codon:yes gene_type:complete